ncbi:CbtB-domain containing protein [Ancylobacter sp. 6x-1]|uniref:CbtB-domain containing protein n=1 Tax=Ancylobacter crimeensis TaxID=2579147 RepID=A0ABT0D9H1_9HYPH|nr:CbtB domain-containing protein [Ancylobacter crimeensis]MCK0196569.1 CbtB-domain containing protein [Ancylobacter crimeensis]
MNTASPNLSAPSHSAGVVHATPAARALAVSIAALLGVFVIGGVGFSHISAMHNASHDVRHANAFPCH